MELTCDMETGVVTKSVKRRERSEGDFMLEFCIFHYPPLKFRGRLKVVFMEKKKTYYTYVDKNCGHSELGDDFIWYG